MDKALRYLGLATGRQELAIAAITDAGMALTLLSSLEKAEKYSAAAEVLSAKADRAKKRQAETKAHQRNLRKGKKK